MALPTEAQLKAYLRVQTTAEDAQFTLWLARATALIEAMLGRPIVAAEQSHTLCPFSDPITSRVVLYLPVVPVSGVTVTNSDGDTVASSTYTLEGQRGRIVFDEDATIAAWYTVAATAGLSAQTGYSTKAEPIISQAITDTVADWYQRRNAGATSETESSASVTYEASLGIPARVMATLAPLMPGRIR